MVNLMNRIRTENIYSEVIGYIKETGTLPFKPIFDAIVMGLVLGFSLTRKGYSCRLNFDLPLYFDFVSNYWVIKDH